MRSQNFISKVVYTPNSVSGNPSVVMTGAADGQSVWRKEVKVMVKVETSISSVPNNVPVSFS